MTMPGENIKRKNISGMEIFLVAVLLFFGILMIVMTPLGAGYDEEQHFYRVWQLSNFKIIPEEQGWRQSQYPNIYIELSYRKQPLVESVGFDYWDKYGRLKLYDHGYFYGSINPRSRYAPPLLLPQALALRYGIGRFDLSALSAYYMSRFAGLLAYIFLIWLTIRLVPFGKWALAALAVAPMAVYQASTISADTITNGIGFLFIGGSLYIAGKDEVRLKEAAILLLLISMLFFSKPNVYPLVVLPFLLIPPSRFSNKFVYSLVILCMLALFGIEVVGWNMISPNPGFSPIGDVNAAEQLKYILSSPLAFPKVILNDLMLMSSRYLTQWIGVYGYDYGSVPDLTYIFFIPAAFLALFLRDANVPSQRTRISLLVVFLLCYTTTLLSLYLTFTSVGKEYVYGVQGRYFIPIFPLLFLALYNPPFLNRFQVGKSTVALFSLAAVTTFAAGLILTYHVTCGSSYYQSGICYQPFYKNFSPLTSSSPSISDGVVLVQEIVPVCDGMNEVQVRVNSPGSASNGGIEIVLSDKSDNLTILQHTVNNDDLPKDAWYGMKFEPEWKSAGKMYILTIRGMDSPTSEGPLLAYSIRPEYPLGNLLENGKPLENDVLFQYGCSVGIQKFLNGTKP